MEIEVAPFFTQSDWKCVFVYAACVKKQPKMCFFNEAIDGKFMKIILNINNKDMNIRTENNNKVHGIGFENQFEKIQTFPHSWHTANGFHCPELGTHTNSYSNKE